MKTTNAMKRISDGLIMPYSKTLVAANPGAYVGVEWDAAAKEWKDPNGIPLVEVPAPVKPGQIPDDADDEEPQADYVDPEPETATDSAEAAEPPAKSRRRKG